MKHEQSVVDLPESGVVLVTGPNGAGKSSLTECVSMAVWGKTLRGTPPWHGTGGCAVVHTDKLQATRTKKGTSSAKLTWQHNGDKPKKFGTSTAAQEELVGIVGGWDAWRRTRVFSSTDITSFATATDKQRKHLIEQFLAGDRFDPALKQCRSDLRAANESYAQLDRKHDVLKERVAGAKKQLSSLEQLELTETQRVPDVDVAKVTAEICELKRLVEDCNHDTKKLQLRVGTAEREVAQAQAAVRSTKAAVDKLDHNRCPTCGQPIPDKLKNALKDDVRVAQAGAKTAQDKAAEFRAEVEDQFTEIDEDRQALLARIHKLNAESGAAREIAKRNKEIAARQVKIETTKQELTQQITKAEKTLVAQHNKLCDYEEEIAELEVCERVLGLEGVRAQILGRALVGIEQLANTVLMSISDDIQIELKPYAETKTAGIKDQIALHIKGAGGGYGYKAASGGERRRIDVALLLALVIVAADAHDVEAGTIWLDEVLDTLDEQGIGAMAELIHEWAGDRLIVVISHSADVVTTLRPDLHLHVEAGAVRTGCLHAA
jgi:DNA repair exonuclease SbcCD ATPase subunit